MEASGVSSDRFPATKRRECVDFLLPAWRGFELKSTRLAMRLSD